MTTYALDVMVDCSAVLLGYIDAGTGVGKIRIRDGSGTLLADVLLNDPGGYVNIITGQLQLDPAGAVSAVESGEASYAEVTDSDNVVAFTIDVAEGETEASGYLVINSVSIASGSSVEITSAVIG